VWSVIGVKS